MTISWNNFEKLDIRCGTIIHAQEFAEAKKPAFKLTIDFGEVGIKKSSAQITDLYCIDTLIGMQILGVINFPPKQIANFISECLVLGLYNKNNQVILLTPERQTENGLKVG